MPERHCPKGAGRGLHALVHVAPCPLQRGHHGVACTRERSTREPAKPTGLLRDTSSRASKRAPKEWDWGRLQPPKQANDSRGGNASLAAPSLSSTETGSACGMTLYDIGAHGQRKRVQRNAYGVWPLARLIWTRGRQ